MNYKQYKALESYYTEVELHLFNNKISFLEFLTSCLDNKEILKECKISKTTLMEFINNITIDCVSNDTDKNILVAHKFSKNYEILIYNLKEEQSYTSFDKVANKYIINNSKGYITQNVKRIILSGILEINRNARIYLYINSK